MSSFQGLVETLDAHHVAGWLCDLDDIRSLQYVTIMRGDKIIAQVTADIYRSDIKLAGKSAGYCGFQYVFNRQLSVREQRLIEILPSASERPLKKSVSSIPKIPPEIRPSIFLVGAPRCGTTSMHHYMSQHPDIYVPGIKEPNFFAADLEIATYPEIDSLEAYLGLFEPGSNHAIAADTSQFHLYSRIAARKIKEFSPAARILIMLRNPMSLVRSLHTQYVTTGDETLPVLADALQLEDARRMGMSIPDTTLFPKCMAYLDVATLSPQVERYMKVFDRERIHFIILEDLVTDPDSVIGMLFSFLGVDPEVDLDMSPKNVSESYTPSGFSKLSDSQIDGIRRRMQDDVDSLSELVGRDLSDWKDRTL